MSRIPYIKKSLETRRAYLSSEKDLSEEDKTYLEHRKMKEGEYQKYADLTSKVSLGDKSKDEKSEVNMMLGSSRTYLINAVGVSWNVIDEDGNDVPFTRNNVKELPPEIIKEWVEDIYDFNPILREEVEDEEDMVITTEGDELPKQ